MQSSRPETSTNFLTIFISRALRPWELNGICTDLNFAARAERSGATTSLAVPDTPCDCVASAALGHEENPATANVATRIARINTTPKLGLVMDRILSCRTNVGQTQGSVECYAREVKADEPENRERNRVGLCLDCAHARRIESERGAIFYLCELAAVNPAFRKYPALPVVICSGYAKKIAG